MNIKHVSYAVTALFAGSVAYGQNTITTTSSPDARRDAAGHLLGENEVERDPLLKESSVIPGYEQGFYGLIGFGVDRLHTHVTCPRMEKGCNGDEVVNVATGKHSEIDGGIGYRFNRYVALEATAALMNGGFNSPTHLDNPRDQRIAETTSMGASWDVQFLRMRFDLPLMAGLSVYGTAGVGLKDFQIAVGELDANDPTSGQCTKRDQITGQCLEFTETNGGVQAVADPPSRWYFPASVGIEWWPFKNPGKAVNINFQPPQGPGPKFYRLSVSFVGGFAL